MLNEHCSKLLKRESSSHFFVCVYTKHTLFSVQIQKQEVDKYVKAIFRYYRFSTLSVVFFQVSSFYVHMYVSSK